MSKKGWIACGCAFALILVFAAGIAGGIYARFQQGNKNRTDNARIWHAVLCDLEVATAANTKVPIADRRRAIVFYDRLLVKDAHAAPCGIKVTGR